jgi:hypothetical protein
MLSYAPGSRVVIRDEEWLIRRVDPSSDGGHLLSCDGVSELVRGGAGLLCFWPNLKIHETLVGGERGGTYRLTLGLVAPKRVIEGRKK